MRRPIPSSPCRVLKPQTLDPKPSNPTLTPTSLRNKVYDLLGAEKVECSLKMDESGTTYDGTREGGREGGYTQWEGGCTLWDGTLRGRTGTL